ncbi:MAG TPA: quinone-dependent dihydroorotate dehydrogenase [Propionibacteriaceae bacterium]|nr:quinone-dependent dihydroorotate dehydrogenase [Propionibacteriaceae bacterium]
MSLRSAVLGAGYRSLVRPALFRAHGGDPELIHESLIALLGGLGPGRRAALRILSGSPTSPVTVAGVRFPGRVGVAAGLDKDGLAVQAWSALGFGFAELGTVTAIAQPGNDRPRLYRLRASRAIINRMGFNNAGAQAMADRLETLGVRRGELTCGIPLGISLGKSKVTPLDEAVPDYVTSLRTLAPYADYVAINVSSPNTPGLRSLQDDGLLRELLTALVHEASAPEHPLGPVPVFVKIAPDLSDAQLDRVVEVVTEHGGSGLIATNTTLSREGLAPRDLPLATQAGGLSGAPLTRRALEVVRRVAGSTSLPVIGVGGIMTPDDAARMVDAGADLVQVYTGFIYGGNALVAGINALSLGRTT